MPSEQSSAAPLQFDTGLRERIDEDTIWHGMGWVTPDAEVRLPIDPNNWVMIKPDGRTRFYNDG